jgi:hypothetical protein
MTTQNCPVACFIKNRIEILGLSQRDITKKVCFKKQNIISMIIKGKKRLPLGKVGLMANALKADPVQLLQMCMEEYHPTTWKVISPFLETAITNEELCLLNALRAWTGGPYLSALSEESQTHFNNFMTSLRMPVTIQ